MTRYYYEMREVRNISTGNITYYCNGVRVSRDIYSYIDTAARMGNGRSECSSTQLTPTHNCNYYTLVSDTNILGAPAPSSRTTISPCTVSDLYSG